MDADETLDITDAQTMVFKELPDVRGGDVAWFTKDGDRPVLWRCRL
jgi:hypothetical protein